jgi:hypothetical protein
MEFSGGGALSLRGYWGRFQGRNLDPSWRGGIDGGIVWQSSSFEYGYQCLKEK